MRGCVVLVVIWLVCGSLTYGMLLADFQNSFPTIAKESCRRDKAAGALIGVAGPLGLFMSFFLTGFAEHGIQFGCGVKHQ